MLKTKNNYKKAMPYMSGHKTKDNYVPIIISVTAVICTILIVTAILLIRSLPKEAFLDLVPSPSHESTELKGCVYPQPDEDIRKKADRLREIRYEEYLEHVYTPLESEMDNVYVYDNHKKCYLTFDDGPSSVTPKILDVLEKYKVKATFFVTGDRVIANPEIAKQIAKGGHTIGNHSYSHQYDSVYGSPSGFEREVAKCKKAIDDALGQSYDNLVFRFPGGYDSLSDESLKASYRNILGKIGYKYIDWSCLTGDSNTTEPTAEYLMDTLKSTIGSSVTGDIVVLMHDSPTKEITAKTLPKIIEYLYENGYEFDILKN